MKKHIGICGLVCSDCAAFIATDKNDDQLRKKTAKEWNERYQKTKRNRSPIKFEDINCRGCLSQGPIYKYCLKCKVRKCGQKKNIKNCQECQNYKCDMLIELQSHFY